MSKWWIKLNDIHVNAMAQTEDDAPFAVLDALSNLYDAETAEVNRKIFLEDEGIEL